MSRKTRKGFVGNAEGLEQRLTTSSPGIIDSYRAGLPAPAAQVSTPTPLALNVDYGTATDSADYGTHSEVQVVRRAEDHVADHLRNPPIFAEMRVENQAGEHHFAKEEQHSLAVNIAGEDEARSGRGKSEEGESIEEQKRRHEHGEADGHEQHHESDAHNEVYEDKKEVDPPEKSENKNTDRAKQEAHHNTSGKSADNTSHHADAVTAQRADHAITTADAGKQGHHSHAQQHTAQGQFSARFQHHGGQLGR